MQKFGKPVRVCVAGSTTSAWSVMHDVMVGDASGGDQVPDPPSRRGRVVYTPGCAVAPDSSRRDPQIPCACMRVCLSELSCTWESGSWRQRERDDARCRRSVSCIDKFMLTQKQTWSHSILGAYPLTSTWRRNSWINQSVT